MRDNIDKFARETLHSVRDLVADGVRLRHLRDQVLIVANLTDAEIDAFHAAGVTFTGSTGKGSTYDMSGYGAVGPYIATYLSNLVEVVDALGWARFSVHIDGNQWIIRKAGHR